MNRVTTDPNQFPQSGVIDVPVPASTGGSLMSGGGGTAGDLGASQSLPSSGGAGGGDAGRPRGWFVAFAIFSTAVLCAVTIALLYSRWWRNDARNSVIAVWGPESWDGAWVEVTGPALPQGGLRAPITKERDLLTRFHVPSGGVYSVRVVGKDRRVVARRDGDPRRPLQPGGVWWPFRAPPAATQLGLQ